MTDDQDANAESGDVVSWTISAVLAFLWKKRRELSEHLQQWFASWHGTVEEPGILIIGAGGVGKSTLGAMVGGELNSLSDFPVKYRESIGLERLRLVDQPGVEILIPPGQSHRREATWHDLFEEVRQGRIRGIVVVNAYGFHSLGEISLRDHRLYDEGDSISRFIARYCEDRRQEELKVVNMLADHIAAAPRPVWMLSIVNKEDLWSDIRNEVQAHYQSGQYEETVQRVGENLGQRRFRHEYVFLSLVINNFATGRNELLASTCAGYDQRKQVEGLETLMATLNALREWEEANK